MKTRRRIEVIIETQKTTVIRVKRRYQEPGSDQQAEEADAPRAQLTSGEPAGNAEPRAIERTKGAKQ